MADRRWVNPPRLRSAEPEPVDRHATWVELFFDLVFVVAVAQLSHLISNHPSATSFLHYALLFAPVWFIWVSFTVYADRFDTDDVPHRLLVLAGMVVVAAVAVHVDDAFSGGPIPFALCSIVARAILLAMNVRAVRAVPAARDFIAYCVRGWSVGLMLWVVSLAVPEPGRYVVWGVAVLVEVTTPLLAERRAGAVRRHRPVPAGTLPGGRADAKIAERPAADRGTLRHGGGRRGDCLRRRRDPAGGHGAVARRGHRRGPRLRARRGGRRVRRSYARLSRRR